MKKMYAAQSVGAGLAALLWADDVGAQARPEDEAPRPAETAQPTLIGQILAGRPILESRARYEHFDQTKTATLRNNAEGTTLRTRLGWETAAYKGVKALVEFDDVRHIGPEHFAITTPGVATPLNGADKARYPAINDPEVTELNRAQLAWAPSKTLSVTAGRQKIQLDDQRFVAAAAWRQDEQTFDALRLDLSRGRFKGTYAYLARVNRSLGERRDWDSDSHLLNVGWSVAEGLNLQGFVYALDFSDAPLNTSITRGVRATGKAKAGPYRLAYTAAFARQSDHHGATSPYALDYFGGDLSATRDIYTIKLAYDSMEGNGTRGFGAPLGAAHAFYGWADAWSSVGGAKSFADGLEDRNLTLNIKPRFKRRWFSNSDLTLRYHDFDDGRTGVDLGHEWNLQLTAALTPKLSVLWKYADFERVKTVPAGNLAPPASRTKMWLSLEYKL